MSLLSVEEAYKRLLAGIQPVGTEVVPLSEANGRFLAEDVYSLRTQPPFDASAMDGYAVRAHDLSRVPTTLQVIGTAAAGHGFDGTVNPGEAVRIFTGAPLPDGADAILIQEKTRAGETGDTVTALSSVPVDEYIRPAGLDFALGQKLLTKGRRLGYRELALAAAMNHDTLRVAKRPKVAFLATGDELVPPGEEPGPDQIVASNGFALGAMLADLGAEPVDLGIAPDAADVIADKARSAIDGGAHVLVTLGGASVGDHDLVQTALGDIGFELGFWRIAMVPGKPLISGHIGPMRVLGLPGNPVSSIVCALLFLHPLVRALQGASEVHRPEETAVLGDPVGGNGERQAYLRARLSFSRSGHVVATPVSFQDSSLLATLSGADALVIRPPFAPPAEVGSPCKIIRL
ncbi:molybdopterin molybdotransferase [Rhodobium orientis]|uniref:Molybdopterin molybdenumtransferase n=1 Tax=Rhodobium orientis TaxID=34017 RepID=A0A327JU18_9HYPH|nr:gephyrin-like molybdotransferase Glp [Rhodobium orientis]MBB4302305.1 molybdopterin molybdotransferase [Rhodobium orientis]MBK5949014.1 molybdopterin molybdenumtransferase MoeA [Rhodobium orientis]RAI29006.1 molybdopterin molybdenumtransferase MoeA [Rhodobium orientis]